MVNTFLPETDVSPESNKKIILSAKDLCKSYGSGDSQVKALDMVSLDIYEGELIAILGNSGSGKSTLLNMLGGMDRFDSGEVTVGRLKLSSLDDRRLTAYRRDKVGFVFQSFNLISELTAKENIALTAKPEDRDVADRMLKLVGLEDRADNYPAQLSGGQQQRVSIARALAKDPDIFLCDEPTGALDSETGKNVLLLLEQLVRKHKKTILIVTHNQEISKIADRTVVMKNGMITDDRKNENVLSVNDVEW